MTLTRRGWGLLLAGALLLLAGAAGRSTLAGALGLLALALVGLAVTTTRPSDVRAERDAPHLTTREGERFRVAVRLASPRRSMGRATAKDRVAPELALVDDPVAGLDATEARIEYHVDPLTPGQFALGPIDVEFEDALGLARRRLTLDVTATVRVLPAAEALRRSPVQSNAARPLAGPFLVGQAGPGSDFFALRDYNAGDTQRDVNWRASARTGGRLVVNQREKESPARVTYLVDGRAIARVGTRRQSAWTMSLRALATLAALDVRQRSRPRVLIHGEPGASFADHAPGDAQLTALLGAAVERPPSGTQGILQALQPVLAQLKPRSPVVLVTSLLEDANVDEALRTLAALEQRVVLVAIDGPALLRTAGAPPERIEAAVRARAAALASARATGAVVVEWRPGERLELALAREAAG